MDLLYSARPGEAVNYMSHIPYHRDRMFHVPIYRSLSIYLYLSLSLSLSLYIYMFYSMHLLHASKHRSYLWARKVVLAAIASVRHMKAFRRVSVTKLTNDEGETVPIIRGGFLDDEEVWAPNCTVTLGDVTFIKLTKTNFMLCRICGGRPTRNQAFETITRLRDTECMRVLSQARSETSDSRDRMSKRAMDASIQLPDSVTIEMHDCDVPGETCTVTVQYVSDLRNALAVSLEDDSLHNVCGTIAGCPVQGSKGKKDSCRLGDGFFYSNKRKTLWSNYTDDDGVKHRMTSRKVLAPDDVDDHSKIADAKEQIVRTAPRTILSLLRSPSIDTQSTGADTQEAGDDTTQSP